jgi:tetratricopeptide (TPR) repeat protein
MLSETAWFVWDEGDLQRAQALMEDALQVHRAIGGHVGICHNLRHLACFIAFQGDYDRAQFLAEEGVISAREMGIKGLLGVCLAILGQYAFYYQGKIEKALVCLDEVLELGRESGHLRTLMLSLSFLGNIHRQQGDLEQAEKLLKECTLLLQDRIIASGLWRVQMYKGDLARVHRDYAEAGALYRESLQLIETRGRRLPDVPPRLDGLGIVAAYQNQPQRAAKLFGAAQALRERMGTVIHPVDQAEYDEHLTLLREAFGKAAFTAAWEAGSAMTPDQAIAYALEEYG